MKRKPKLDSAQGTTDFLLAKILLQLKINQDLTVEWLKACMFAVKAVASDPENQAKENYPSVEQLTNLAKKFGHEASLSDVISGNHDTRTPVLMSSLCDPFQVTSVNQDDTK